MLTLLKMMFFNYALCRKSPAMRAIIFYGCVNCLQQNSRVMSHSLSNWLSHIKTDDIDGGLAADFDGSFSGLGSELGSNPYNMRYLLVDVFICQCLWDIIVTAECLMTSRETSIKT